MKKLSNILCTLLFLATKGISYSQSAINGNATPYIPEDWTLVSHVNNGVFIFDSTKIQLFVEQKEKDFLNGSEILAKLKGKNILNANTLDFLLKHKELIPASWKFDEEKRVRFIIFLGTVYRKQYAGNPIRMLYWRNGEWAEGIFFLDNDFGNYPARCSVPILLK